MRQTVTSDWATNLVDSGEEAELTLGGAERHGAEKGSLERSVRETEREGPGLPGQQDEQGQVQTLESRNQLSWTLRCQRLGEEGDRALTSYRRDMTLHTYGGS